MYDLWTCTKVGNDGGRGVAAQRGIKERKNGTIVIA